MDVYELPCGHGSCAICCNVGYTDCKICSPQWKTCRICIEKSGFCRSCANHINACCECTTGQECKAKIKQCKCKGQERKCDIHKQLATKKLKKTKISLPSHVGERDVSHEIQRIGNYTELLNHYYKTHLVNTRQRARSASRLPLKSREGQHAHASANERKQRIDPVSDHKDIGNTKPRRANSTSRVSSLSRDTFDGERQASSITRNTQNVTQQRAGSTSGVQSREGQHVHASANERKQSLGPVSDHKDIGNTRPRRENSTGRVSSLLRERQQTQISANERKSRKDVFQSRDTFDGERQTSSITRNTQNVTQQRTGSTSGVQSREGQHAHASANERKQRNDPVSDHKDIGNTKPRRANSTGRVSSLKRPPSESSQEILNDSEINQIWESNKKRFPRSTNNTDSKPYEKKKYCSDSDNPSTEYTTPNRTTYYSTKTTQILSETISKNQMKDKMKRNRLKSKEDPQQTEYVSKDSRRPPIIRREMFVQKRNIAQKNSNEMNVPSACDTFLDKTPTDINRRLAENQCTKARHNDMSSNTPKWQAEHTRNHNRNIKETSYSVFSDDNSHISESVYHQSENERIENRKGSFMSDSKIPPEQFVKNRSHPNRNYVQYVVNHSEIDTIDVESLIHDKHRHNNNEKNINTQTNGTTEEQAELLNEPGQKRSPSLENGLSSKEQVFQPYPENKFTQPVISSRNHDNSNQSEKCCSHLRQANNVKHQKKSQRVRPHSVDRAIMESKTDGIDINRNNSHISNLTGSLTDLQDHSPYNFVKSSTVDPDTTIFKDQEMKNRSRKKPMEQKWNTHVENPTENVNSTQSHENGNEDTGLHSRPMFGETYNVNARHKSHTSQKASSRQLSEMETDYGYPQGIPNVGMTCYANSILQVLSQTPNLNDRLQRSVKMKNLDRENTVTGLLLSLIGNINISDSDYSRSGEHVRRLLQRVFIRDESFTFGQQNDAHSFMLTLFEAIDNESGSDTLNLFKGQMSNSFTYSKCSHLDVSERQIFTSLLVPIPATYDGRVELEYGISQLLTQEEFSEGVLNCRMCMDNKETIATKQLVFDKPPSILVVQLGTFREVRDWYGHTVLEKGDSAVRYTEKLCLPLNSTEVQFVDYSLYGVVCHSGSLQGGHYTSYIKSCNHHLSKWYKCNDSWVQEISECPAGKYDRQACLLFYKQQ